MRTKCTLCSQKLECFSLKRCQCCLKSICINCFKNSKKENTNFSSSSLFCCECSSTKIHHSTFKGVCENCQIESEVIKFKDYEQLLKFLKRENLYRVEYEEILTNSNRVKNIKGVVLCRNCVIEIIRAREGIRELVEFFRQDLKKKKIKVNINNLNITTNKEQQMNDEINNREQNDYRNCNRNCNGNCNAYLNYCNNGNNNNNNINNNSINQFDDNANNLLYNQKVMRYSGNQSGNICNEMGGNLHLDNNNNDNSNNNNEYFNQQIPQYNNQNNLYSYENGNANANGNNNLDNYYQQILRQNSLQNQLLYNYNNLPQFGEFPMQNYDNNFQQINSDICLNQLCMLKFSDFCQIVNNNIAYLNSKRENLTNGNIIGKNEKDKYSNMGGGKELDEINMKIELMRIFNLLHETGLNIIEEQQREIASLLYYAHYISSGNNNLNAFSCYQDQ